MRVIGDKKAALARINMLVGLAGIAAHGPVAAGRRAVPRRSHRVGAILDHGHTGGVAHRHEAVHVANMPAHMAEQQDARPVQLGLQIVKVDGQRIRHADEYGRCADGGNGPRNGREGERIAEHRVAMADADRAQGRGHGVAARCDGKAVLCTDAGGKFLFQQCDLGQFAGRSVVAVQPTMAHDGHRRLDRGFRDRFLLGEIACETLCHRSCVGMRAPQVKRWRTNLIA